jgi:hypothetical protein
LGLGTIHSLPEIEFTSASIAAATAAAFSSAIVGWRWCCGNDGSYLRCDVSAVERSNMMTMVVVFWQAATTAAQPCPGIGLHRTSLPKNKNKSLLFLLEGTLGFRFLSNKF